MRKKLKSKFHSRTELHIDVHGKIIYDHLRLIYGISLSSQS